jgi:arylsulfatase A-like enzyme
MPHETGVDYNGAAVLPSIPTLGEVFREAGYETAWAGKWHLGVSYPGIPFAMKPRPDSGQARGFEVLPVAVDRSHLSRYHYGAFSDEPVADSAISFMDRKRNRPFLLAVGLHNPHDICGFVSNTLPDYHPCHRGAGHLRPDQCPPLPDNFEPDPEEPEFITRCRKRRAYGPELAATGEWGETQWRAYLYAYYRLTERVDATVGRILAAIRTRKLEENTLVVFTSDHGEGVAAHRWAVKLMLFEEVVGVPLLLRWKGVVPRSRVQTTVTSGFDLLPTLCDYAAVKPPAVLRGRSLRPLVENGRWDDRPFVPAELAPEPGEREMQGRMLAGEHFKYVVFSQGRNPEMLFDLRRDPGEKNNLARHSAFRGELEHHRSMLNRWMQEANDPFQRLARS